MKAPMKTFEIVERNGRTVSVEAHCYDLKDGYFIFYQLTFWSRRKVHSVASALVTSVSDMTACARVRDVRGVPVEAVRPRHEYHIGGRYA